MEKEKILQGQNLEQNENSVENVFETRKNITNALKSALENNPKVFAAFLAGADGHGCVDEYSDIDFDIVCDPDSIDEIEKTVKETLETFSPIKTELKRVIGGNHLVIYQFEKISKFLHVDVMFMNRADDLESKVNVLFDKKNFVKVKELTKEELTVKIENRVKEIEKYSELRQAYVEASLKRGDYFEAEDKYRYLVLNTLIEALRLQYCPEKSDYGVKHITKDLPEDVVKQVEDLYKVGSVEELKEKNEKAKEVLSRTLEKLKL